MSDATSQQRQQLETELDQLREANFELQATLATLQAEQQVALQQLQQQHKEQESKWQHALRLEQRTSQRLSLQQAQHAQQLQQMMEDQQQQQDVDASTSLRLSKRPRDNNTVSNASPRRPSIPPTITTTTPPTNHVLQDTAVETTSHLTRRRLPFDGPMPLPSSSTTTVSSTTPAVGPLARHLLLQLPSTSSHPNGPSDGHASDSGVNHSIISHSNNRNSNNRNSNNSNRNDDNDNDPVLSWTQIRNVLQSIALSFTNTTSTTNSTHPHAIWNETLLLEFLLMHAPVDWWWAILTWSGTARQALVEAVVQLQQEDDDDNDNDENREDQDKGTVHSSSSRIQWVSSTQRHHCDAMLEDDDNNNNEMANRPATLDPLALENLRQSMRQVWYTPNQQQQQQQQQHPPGLTFPQRMDPVVLQDWMHRRLRLDSPAHWQVLAVALQDDSRTTTTTTVWWDWLLTPLTRQLMQVHYLLMTSTTEEQGRSSSLLSSKDKGRWSAFSRSTKGSSSFSSTTTSSNSKSKIIRFNCPHTTASLWLKQHATAIDQNKDMNESDQLHEALHESLLACITLMLRLVQRTRADRLVAWYTAVQAPESPPQPSDNGDEDGIDPNKQESALVWIGMLLDILETVNVVGSSDKPPMIPSWYPTLTSLWSAIGTTREGWVCLRTRLTDATGTQPMPNVLETAAMQLFHLSFQEEMDSFREYNVKTLMQGRFRDDSKEDDAAPSLSFGMRLVEGWVRLWHQTLFYVQERNTTSSVDTITFRSLVLDCHEFYVSGCARLLTDPLLRPEVAVMIRMQLEELAMDEDEYEDLRHQSS